MNIEEGKCRAQCSWCHRYFGLSRADYSRDCVTSVFCNAEVNVPGKVISLLSRDSVTAYVDGDGDDDDHHDHDNDNDLYLLLNLEFVLPCSWSSACCSFMIV